MTEVSDGVAEEFAAKVRQAVMLGSQAAQQIAAGRARRHEAAAREGAASARALEARWRAEKNAARAELRQARGPGWWDAATPGQMARVWQVAAAWAPYDAGLAAEAERVRAALESQYGAEARAPAILVGEDAAAVAPEASAGAERVPSVEEVVALLDGPSWADRPAEAGGGRSTSLDRIEELNRAAAEFYQTAYPGSDSAAYIASRLGDDLTGDSRWILGHAPNSWTALTDHLTERLGATADELVDAGLAKISSRGTPIDIFRNRVLFGITDGSGQVAGWTGRKLPGSPERAPKYLNTPATALFDKSALLYSSGLLEEGCMPVLVEGPMDAIAVTLAGDRDPMPELGRAKPVGVAPCGTALTPGQVDILRPHIEGRPVVVGLDDDAAGWKAAERDFKLLTDVGATPHRLIIKGGKDPADMLAADRGSGLPELSNEVREAGGRYRTLASDLVEHKACELRRHNRETLTPERWREMEPEGGLDVNQRIRLIEYAASLVSELPAHDQWLAAQVIAREQGLIDWDVVPDGPAGAPTTAEMDRQEDGRRRAEKEQAAPVAYTEAELDEPAVNAAAPGGARHSPGMPEARSAGRDAAWDAPEARRARAGRMAERGVPPAEVQTAMLADACHARRPGTGVTPESGEAVETIVARARARGAAGARGRGA